MALKPKYAYFPGCNAEGTGIAYTESSNYVLDKLGVDFAEIPDWNCCGTSAAHVTGKDLSIGLAARSLALAEQMDSSLDIVAPCAGCYTALKTARHYARQSEDNRKHVEDIIDMPYSAEQDVLSLLEIFASPEAVAAVAEKVTRKLSGLKVACYYGCTIVRPAKITNFENPEDPMSMDNLMTAIGADPIDWGFKTECCGAANSMTVPGPSVKLLDRIFQNARANGAECIATACPLCWLNLDMRENQVNAARADKFDMPVFYFTELMALAMGATNQEAGVVRHFWPAEQFASRDFEAEAAAAAAAAEEKAAAEKAAKQEAAKKKAAERKAAKEAEEVAK